MHKSEQHPHLITIIDAQGAARRVLGDQQRQQMIVHQHGALLIKPDCSWLLLLLLSPVMRQPIYISSNSLLREVPMPADAFPAAAAAAVTSGVSPESFLTLDDSLLGEIKRAARQNPQCPHLRAAAAILRRLDSRDLYLWVVEVTVPEQVRKRYVYVMLYYVMLYDIKCDMSGNS
jgi:hypothetical protein